MRTALIIAGFLLFSAQNILADTGDVSFEKYRSQSLLYLFLTDDLQSLIDASSDATASPDERELIQFFSQLQGLQFLQKEEVKNHVPERLYLDVASLRKLQGIAYENGRYDESLALSRLLPEKREARYREGLSLYGLKKQDEAESILTGVPPDDPYYPYAVIYLAQKKVEKQNLSGAEDYIRQLLAHSPMAGDRLSERSRLLLGQVLFEKGLYSDAFREFMSIKSDSLFYKDALSGQAWCYIKLGDYEKAAYLLEKMDKGGPSEQEIRLTLGYCYIKLNKLLRAKELFDGLLTNLNSDEREITRIIEDKSLRKRYTSILLKEDPRPATEDERRYLSYLNMDPAIKEMALKGAYLGSLKARFLAIAKEVEDDNIYLENITNNLNETVGRIEEKIKLLKDAFLSANVPLEPNESASAENQGDIDDYASNLYGTWGYIAEPKVSNETKYVAKLILREFIKDPQSRCFDDVIVCHIANFASFGKGYFDKSDIRKIAELLDSIVTDLKSVRSGNSIILEGFLPGIRDKVNRKVEVFAERLNALKEVEAEAHKNIDDAERGIETFRGMLDSRILQDFVKAKYELGDFKARIIAGINIVESSLNERIKAVKPVTSK